MNFRRKHEPVIYFIRRESDGLIKIGRTTRLAARVGCLKAEHCSSMEVLGYEAEGPQTEPALHERFAEERREGEWFAPSARLLDYIHENASDCGFSPRAYVAFDMSRDVITYREAAVVLGVKPTAIPVLVLAHGLTPKVIPVNGKAKGLDRKDMAVLRRALGLRKGERLAPKVADPSPV